MSSTTRVYLDVIQNILDKWWELDSRRAMAQPARTAEELIQVIQPHIFGSDGGFTVQKRLALQAKWIYQAQLLKAVEQSLYRHEGRWRRLLRLAWFSAINPRVVMAPGLWERVPGFRSFSSNKTTAQS
jgi:hypothetical protein